MAVQFIATTFTETDFAANLLRMYSACTALIILLLMKTPLIFLCTLTEMYEKYKWNYVPW